MIVIVCGTGCLQQARKSEGSSSEPGTAVKTVTVLQEWGGRVSWLHGEDRIAFDRSGTDSLFDVYVMNLDGSHAECLTCGGNIPELHNGNPVWHPSGEYIVFQAQDPELQGLPPTAVGSYIASPGVGINNNLWIMTSDGTAFWQLTHVGDRFGTLHPQISPTGKKLLWSEVISPVSDIGTWEIRLADLVTESGEPHITNVETMRPLDLQLYEVHGFSPDGKNILFSGIEEGKYYYDFEIYVMNVETGITHKLTDNDEWDEHAHFTPDGRIMWVSSQGIPQVKGGNLQDIMENPPKFEYWIMNSDGSGKRQLSGFNRPGTPEYTAIEGGIGLGDFDVGPDGKTIVAKMRMGRGHEKTVLIEFDLENAASNVLRDSYPSGRLMKRTFTGIPPTSTNVHELTFTEPLADRGLVSATGRPHDSWVVLYILVLSRNSNPAGFAVSLAQGRLLCLRLLQQPDSGRWS
ncbi:MAG: PD40 domain-containing protein [Theionarchaea archaeon]|nr:PD40 domain-containing protein [Theionarchaea archaeon]